MAPFKKGEGGPPTTHNSFHECPAARECYLKHLAITGIMGAAITDANAELADDDYVERKEVQAYREVSEEFDRQCREAEDHSTDLLEREARRRAAEGWDEPVFMKARDGTMEQAGVIRKYDSTMLIFLLKGNRPEKFREQSQIAITGPNGGPLQIESARAALAEKLIRKIESRKSAAIEAAIDVETTDRQP